MIHHYLITTNLVQSFSNKFSHSRPIHISKWDIAILLGRRSPPGEPRLGSLLQELRGEREGGRGETSLEWALSSA